MKRQLLLAPVLALAVTGCGNSETTKQSDDPADTSSPAAKTVGTCSADDPALKEATKLVTGELTGDGQAQDLRLTAAGGACPNTLFAQVGDGFVSLPLGEVTVTADKAAAIRIPGRDGDVVMARETHPRGGFQVHLYAVADGQLGEILAGGQPVLPFVATDTSQGTPVSADCTEGGITITSAVAHEPIGVAFAWDLTESKVTIDGNTATAGGATEIEDNVLPEQLASEHAALVTNEFFSDCTVF